MLLNRCVKCDCAERSCADLLRRSRIADIENPQRVAIGNKRGSTAQRQPVTAGNERGCCAGFQRISRIGYVKKHHVMVIRQCSDVPVNRHRTGKICRENSRFFGLLRIGNIEQHQSAVAGSNVDKLIFYSQLPCASGIHKTDFLRLLRIGNIEHANARVPVREISNIAEYPHIAGIAGRIFFADQRWLLRLAHIHNFQPFPAIRDIRDAIFHLRAIRLPERNAPAR